MRFDDEMIAIMHTANYIIDCHDPGDWATHVTVRLAFAAGSVCIELIMLSNCNLV